MSRYYICNVCGNLIDKVVDGGNTPICCGKTMTELKPASTDGAKEKHVPVVTGCEEKHCVTVQVGSTLHPAETYHYIQWIAIETTKGFQRKHLRPEDEPVATFYLDSNEKVLKTFAYCNLHGLWCS